MDKIALIFGGPGSESEVSKETCDGFAMALGKLGEDYIKLEANNDLSQKLIKEKPRLALLAGHGKYAEDGTLQGLCEFLKIPYSGSGVMSSSTCMDKAFCKSLFEKNEIPTAKYQIFNGAVDHINKYSLELSFPIVVKPSRNGSSIGVTIVKQENEFEPALELAARYDCIILIEKFIEGKEVTVPILGDKALTSIEIDPKQDFYNYQNKYTAGHTNYVIPANIEKKTSEKIKDYSLKACELLRVRSYARVDFMLDKNEAPYIIEVNTLPGCTPNSLLPKSAEFEGIAFTELVKHLIDTARLDYEGLI